MQAVKAAVRRLIVADRRAVTSVEYGLIGLLVFLALVAGVMAGDTSLASLYNAMLSTVAAAL